MVNFSDIFHFPTKKKAKKIVRKLAADAIKLFFLDIASLENQAEDHIILPKRLT